MVRNICFIISMLINIGVFAQDTVLYKFNNLPAKSWEETIIYSVLTYDSEDELGAQLNKYLKNGSRLSESYFVDYKNEIRQGEQKKWYSNGQLASKVNYNLGMKEGYSRNYSISGFLYRERYYEKGQIVSDTTYEDPTAEGEEKYVTIVEAMPLFPGCETKPTNKERMNCSNTEIYKHVMSSVKYPAIARDNGISGVIYVQYIINTEGKIEDVSIAKSVEKGELLEAEAIRVVKSLPQMIPATQFGEYVKVQYNIPVSFRLITDRQIPKRKPRKKKRK